MAPNKGDSAIGIVLLWTIARRWLVVVRGAITRRIGAVESTPHFQPPALSGVRQFRWTPTCWGQSAAGRELGGEW